MTHDFHGWTVCQVYENRLVLGEVLGFVEISRLQTKSERLRECLRRNLRQLVEAECPPSLYRRHISGAPALASVTITLEPAGDRSGWREPVTLAFPIVRWSHTAEMVEGKTPAVDMELAFVPALGIVVAAERAGKLEERLIPQIRAALGRGKPLALPRLVELQRAHTLRIERVSVPVQLRSAKARVQASETNREPSVLRQVATEVSAQPAQAFFGRETVLDSLAEYLRARSARSVLLVGPSGVGKTALFHALATRRAAHELGATPFLATSGARLVAGMCGFGMWQERVQHVVREAGRKKAILHLGNLVELMSVGKSEHNLQGVASFLRPYLARGDLLAVAECTNEQAALIEREDPHLLDAFHRLDVPEPDAAEGLTILRLVAGGLRPPGMAALSAEVLDIIDALHRRYASYSAYPGRPLRFLRNLLQDRRDAPALTPADVLDAFARETGLPRVLLDPAVPLHLARTTAWFTERVVDQPEAVERVVDLLAGVKAWLTRPRRPIGSLLFIGPTGVGKTEMAKALAEFLFGSRSRLTRFDMSEFGDSVSVQRLVGDAFGKEGLLTARVREQPFSVLLLDEFEKADPRFFDLLLQVLGEGRLTDAAGRLADFSNTVVILTSNLGAESFEKGGFGFAGAASSGGRADAARDHFTRAVQDHLRPELFNRIDRIVPFLPLPAAAIRRIAERHLKLLETRDGIRYRGALLHHSPEVAEHLAAAGFDDRYGARPLLRAVEREMLAPLADAMNRYSGTIAVSAEIALKQRRLHVEVRARTDESGNVIQVGSADAPLLEAAHTCVDLRRGLQAMEACVAMRELANELFQLEREHEQWRRAQLRHAARMARLAKAPEEARRRNAAAAPAHGEAEERREAVLARLRELVERVHKLSANARALEEVALHALYAGPGQPSLPPADLLEAAEPVRRGSDDFLATLYCRQFPAPDRVTLVLFGEDPMTLLDLAEGYWGIAQATPGHSCKVLAYRLPKAAAPRPLPTTEAEVRDASSPETPCWRDDRLIAPAAGRQPEQELLIREWVHSGHRFKVAPEHLIGIALHLRGPAVAPRFGSESGLHVFTPFKAGASTKCLVEVSDAALKDYLPPAGITRRGAIGTQEERRTYHRAQQTIADRLLAKRVPWQDLSKAIAAILEELLQRRMRELLQE